MVRENVGGFMDRYILKFLGAAVSLNLFSIGIANSMMPTSLERIHKLSIDIALKNKVYDRITGEEIPLGGIDKNEILSDGTMIIYVSQKTVKSDLEKYKKIVKNSDMYDDIRKYKSWVEFMEPAGGALIGAVCMGLSDSKGSNLLSYIGITFGFIPGVYSLVRNVHRGISGNLSRENPDFQTVAAKCDNSLGGGVIAEYVADYPYGIVIVIRPEYKNKQFGVHHSFVSRTDSFRKDRLIKEIAKGY